MRRAHLQALIFMLLTASDPALGEEREHSRNVTDPSIDPIQSRVVQLYYFRDENRVAEIINQNVMTLRPKTDTAIADQLQKVRDALDEAAVQRRVAEATVRSLARQSAQAADSSTLVSLAGSSQSRPITSEEIAAVEDLRRLEKQEQNLRTRQFLLESQLSDTDPGAYAPGDPAAADPAAQVALHVVGKGQIHLRGPLAGINKMARMIHQIDKPVGQVKVGIYSVQINLGQSVKVDDIHEVIDLHVSHARFLSFQTALLFRQAVDKVASEVGNHGGRSFAEDFFCDYFVHEMGKMEGHEETGAEALQSLGSFNSLNLVGSLYLASLADDVVRRKIFDEFLDLANTRVPAIEMDYCRSLKSSTRTRLAAGVLMGKYQKRPTAIKDEDIIEHARRKLRFTHLRDLFRSHETGSGAHNSVQAATIQLLLGLKRLRIAELELSNLRLERALASQPDKAGSRIDRELVDQFIDEQESLVVDLRETLRSAVAAVDSQLKQMAIAFEEDIQSQFYKPAFAEIRRAAENWQVSLGQIETTTIVTNDRMVAKVSPGQTTQLDLPKRQTLIGEGMGLVNAFTEEGQSLATRLGAQSVAGPAGSAVADATVSQTPGASLEKLVPHPDVYTFEAGNQFEITPIIQPDGESIAYEFVYAYSNDVSEGGDPGDPGFSRIKRHFVKTEVQSTSYELREISRFRTALSARRQGRGIPLLSEIPLIGFLARPLPSVGHGRQENIILADCVVYPTIFNLIGNDWLHPIEESTPHDLITEERKLLARREQIRTHLLSASRAEVESLLGDAGKRTLSLPAPTEPPTAQQAKEELPTRPQAPLLQRPVPLKTAESSEPIRRTSLEEPTRDTPDSRGTKPAEDGWQKSPRAKRTPRKQS